MLTDTFRSRKYTLRVSICMSKGESIYVGSMKTYVTEETLNQGTDTCLARLEHHDSHRFILLCLVKHCSKN